MSAGQPGNLHVVRHGACREEPPARKTCWLQATLYLARLFVLLAEARCQNPKPARGEGKGSSWTFRP